VAEFWTTEAEPGRVNDSILLAGIKGPFTAEPRFSFSITDTTLLATLSHADSALRLSVSTPTWQGVGNWKDIGTPALNKLYDSNSSSVDSLRFQVLAWDLSDAGFSSAAWKDTASRWNRRFLVLGDTLANLPESDAKDTIWLKVKGAYADRSQLQSRELPELEKLLADRRGHKHLVHLRLIPDTSGVPDSLSAMLRLGGQWAYDGAKRPSLLFGPDQRADTIPSKFRVGPQSIGENVYAVAYTLRYRGDSGAMVVPLQRGLHVSLDRGRLLDSLEAGLRRLDFDPLPRPAGALSLAYYVPFAAITLPILPAELEGDLPVRVTLRSSVDTLLADNAGSGLTREDRVGVDSSISPWYTTEVGHPENVVNKVSLSYSALNDSLRRVILGYSKDSAGNDTVFLPVGGKAQLTSSLSGYGKGNQLVIQVEALDSLMIARSYLSLRSGEENNSFRDPATGKTVDDLDSALPRFVHPKDDSIRLRATSGIQTLLNRTGLGDDSRHDFEFRPYYRAYTDSAISSAGTKVAQEVRFPLLSTLQPRIESGVLKVDLDVYLYPLKAR
jgi:hypothetical protein